MAFVEKKFKPENYDEFKRVLGSAKGVNIPHRWLVDEDRKIHFFDFGGRGEMPASTGAPPNQYTLVIESSIYYFESRRNMVQGEFGGTSCAYRLERTSFPDGNLLRKDEVIALLKEALTESDAIGRRLIRAVMFDEIIIL